MPEAPVDLDRLAEPREHEVGPAWQIAPVEAKSIAQSMSQSTDNEFRRCVTAFDGAHHAAALSG